MTDNSGTDNKDRHLEQQQEWKRAAKIKKDHRDSLVTKQLINFFSRDDIGNFDSGDYDDKTTESLLSPLDIEITTSPSLSSLLQNIATQLWTSEQVVTSFCKRALIAHSVVNCCTEFCFDTALQRARELDAHLKKTGKTIGPLHGLPISFKDQIDIEGVESTLCYVSRIGNVSKENAVIVDLLVKQGAIPFVKTNMPQTIMSAETVNHIYGSTSNPFNRKLSAGGSSGGEGALIAMKGSILGVGTDIAGSVRIPSAYQGLYALKPSYNRLPFSKTSMVIKGQDLIPCVLGPLSSTIDSLKIFFKTIADTEPWNYDATVIRQPWNENAYNLVDHGGENANLCFAILWDDGVCKPMPPYFRALQQTKLALESKGHKVINWSAHRYDKASEIMWRIFLADGGKEITDSCQESGEPRIGFTDPEHYASLAARKLSAFEYWQLAQERDALVQKQLELWEQTRSQTGTGRPVDAIICPTMASLPLPHGMGIPKSPYGYISYCAFSNVADYVAASIPVTFADSTLDKKPAPHEFRSQIDKKLYELYDPDFYNGVPVGIQCVGRKNEEEAVIRMAEIVDNALKEGKK